MSTVPKAVGAPSSGLVGGRAVTGAHNVAVRNDSPVSELSPQIGVQAETAEQRFQDYARGFDSNPQSARQWSRPVISFRSSQDFLSALVATIGNTNREAANQNGDFRARPVTLPRATRIYEKNALAIHDAPPDRGQTLNASL
ncbi:MAG: hypothetical protein OQJ76_01340 [Rhodospirillales bacterium]|nr:hypothetical protein [Rhodospirillales bacterium]